MDEIPAFRMGRSIDDHVVVSVRTRENPEATDYWDDNWLVAQVTLAAGAFRGSFDAQLRSDEFARFRDALRALDEKLDGRAVFDPTEPWLHLDVQGDGRGHFRIAGQACDGPGVGNRLTFEMAIDQTELPEIVRGLEAILRAFPVVGRRGSCG